MLYTGIMKILTHFGLCLQNRYNFQELSGLAGLRNRQLSVISSLDVLRQQLLQVIGDFVSSRLKL